MNIKAGTRSSNLAVTQTGNTLNRINDLFPQINFELVKMSSPGDRDKQSDLITSAQDFFTEDLDNALLNNDIDCAIHSAKDLPAIIHKDIDWFWLPWREDPRDAIIENQNANKDKLVIGVSSERRIEYAKKHYPNAELIPIRGNIEERIAQVDDGTFDLFIIAGAALNRLGLEHRISKWISLEDLPAPAGQGYIAVTFRKNDKRFCELRKLFSKTVVFAGSGAGDENGVTLATVEALQNCEVCLYDALSSNAVLKYVNKSAEMVYVGKRSGEHSIKQDEICELIANYARQGKRVVRLKGGDPGVFGRLAEEVDTLNDLKIAYRVLPGISSLNMATSTTGLLLTRRGLSRGFSVMTPRAAETGKYLYIDQKERADFPAAYFMSISEIKNITDNLISEGKNKDCPATVVYSAGRPEQKIFTSTIAKLAEEIVILDRNKAPGLLLIGENFNSDFLFQNHGALKNKKILLTCSENIMKKAEQEVLELGGIPIKLPLIKLRSSQCNIKTDKYDCLIVTSPAAVDCLIEKMQEEKCDFRSLPKIMVSGPETEKRFIDNGIYPDFVANKNYGAEGLIEIAKKMIKKDWRVLRLKSDLATNLIKETLEQECGCEVREEILYHNEIIKYDSLPEFDIAVFASSSAISAFKENFGLDILKDKTSAVIGNPSEKTLLEFDKSLDVIKPKNATIKETILEIALKEIGM